VRLSEIAHIVFVARLGAAIYGAEWALNTREVETPERVADTFRKRSEVSAARVLNREDELRRLCGLSGGVAL
jgi:hypothetical protein